jgi:hypothetical protein
VSVARNDTRQQAVQRAVPDRQLGGDLRIFDALRTDRPDAAALAERPDEDLAHAMRAGSARIWQLRLCGYSHADRWHRETDLLAALVDADVGLLRTLLRALGVRL